MYVNLHSGATRGTISNPAEAALLHRVRHAQPAHRQAGLLPAGQARAGGNLPAPLGARPGRRALRCRKRAVDQPREPHRGAHRFLLRVPVEVLAAVPRSGVPRDVGQEQRRGAPLLPARARRHALVRPGGHAHRPRQRQRVRRARGVLPRPARLLGPRRARRAACTPPRCRCGTSPASSRRPTTSRRGASPIPAYPLRPEIIESTWYLYRATGDPAYRALGRQLFEDFVRRCRTAAGYAALADVTTGEQADDMESFVLAETFKYFYLLFAPAATLDLEARGAEHRGTSPAAARAATLAASRVHDTHGRIRPRTSRQQAPRGAAHAPPGAPRHRVRAPHAPRPAGGDLAAAVAGAVGAVDRRRWPPGAPGADRVRARRVRDARGRLRHQRLRRPRHRPARAAHARPAAGGAARLAHRGAGAVRGAGPDRALPGDAAGPVHHPAGRHRRAAHRLLSVPQALLPAAAAVPRDLLRRLERAHGLCGAGRRAAARRLGALHRRGHVGLDLRHHLRHGRPRGRPAGSA